MSCSLVMRELSHGGFATQSRHGVVTRLCAQGVSLGVRFLIGVGCEGGGGGRGSHKETVRGLLPHGVYAGLNQSWGKLVAENLHKLRVSRAPGGSVVVRF